MSYYSSDDDSDASSYEESPPAFSSAPPDGFGSAYGNVNAGIDEEEACSDDPSDDSSSDHEQQVTVSTTSFHTDPTPALRGKTLRAAPDSDDDDDDDNNNNSSEEESEHAPAVAQEVVRPNVAVPPRGKELRLAKKVLDSNHSSSDDEPLVRKRSAAKPKTKAAKKAATPPSKKKAAAPAKKSASARKPTSKRKDPPLPAPSDSEDSDEDVVAAVVVDSDDDVDAVAVAEPVGSNTNNSTSSNKRIKTKEGNSKMVKGVKTKGGSKTLPLTPTTPVIVVQEVSPEQLKAAEDARAKLRSAVTALPHAVNEFYTIRCFGRIQSENTASGSVGIDFDSPLEALFSSPHSIYPVGFSCDRLEFSPIHGRVIKIRCDILDGRTLKQKRQEEKHKSGKQTKRGTLEPMLIDEKERDHLGDGPVFRVMWGEGIEEDDDAGVSFPFDPTGGYADRGARVNGLETPMVGMRVSVLFDDSKLYEGKIIKVASNAKKNMASKSLFSISILYDDGVTENTTYPDPDIYLYPPGCPPIEQDNGWVTELHGKPVCSVLANTPLEAWGKTLLSLGLIDEIIYEEALKTVQKSREEGLSEARDRIDAANKKRRDDRAKERTRQSARFSMDSRIDDDGTYAESKGIGDSEIGGDGSMDTDEQAEAPSAREIQLREKLEELKKELEDARKSSRSVSVDLARARISLISPFAANPFLCGADATSQEMSLMAAAVKKEKSKMGNTGNKRKVVTPATMMDRSDTFFTQEIERFIEGLPGSEFAPLYVFHANRTAAAISNHQWIHEMKVRHQNALQKKLEKERKAEEEAEAKANIEREKLMKRKAKEEEVANRKRQKEEEEEQKRRERVEKRLTQLTLQMDERLIKESYFLRERSVMTYVKALSKEFFRRRKIADTVVAHKMDQLLPTISDTKSTALPIYCEMLPPLSDRLYDEAVVRIWDFLHCFRDAFVENGSNASLPTLDSLQDAIDTLKKGDPNDNKYAAAIELIEDIAISLCRAISPGLTKCLAASTYQAEANKGSTEESACFPVTKWTWREVARMSFIAELLTDLGYSKNDSANIVKGYRSGGHPNSKEAKRWKKIEDSPVVMLYQQLNSYDESVQYRRRIVTARLSTPCNPSCLPNDWRFFLHNIRSRTSNSVCYIKDNVEKSLLALKNNPQETTQDLAHNRISELERCLSILNQTPSGHSADPGLIKAKDIALGVLDSTKETFAATQQLKREVRSQSKEPPRQKMGLLKNYQLSREQYRSLELAKEDYMVAALKLKEELEAKNRDDVAVLSDEEDDDYDGDAPGEKSNNESDIQRSEASDAGATSIEHDTAVGPSNDGLSLLNPAEAAVKTTLDIKASVASVKESTTGASDITTPESSTSAVNQEIELGTTLHLSSGQGVDSLVATNKVCEDKKITDQSQPDPFEPPFIKQEHSSAPCAVDCAAVTLPNDVEPCGTASDHEFCADVPTAPDLIRRCLAVVRTLCSSTSAEPFIYPVDPQLYPGYYESVTSPMSLYDVGNYLHNVAQSLSTSSPLADVEHIVAEFGRKIRKIFHNSLAYNMGNKEHLTMNSAEEMLRLFERLFFDWVLAPSKPALRDLDDDKCIDHHVSDMTSMVILCDGCEGKYNMSRLKPPLVNVPSGEWYCPRCVSGRCWVTVDPRIGRRVKSGSFSGTVESCKFVMSEKSEHSILYCIRTDVSGSKEFWVLKDVDEAIVGDPVSPISCLTAVAECSGYSFGRDAGILGNSLPLSINPFVSDNAAQSALSSTVFQDTVLSCITLMNNPEDLNALEWVNMLLTLMAKCSSSDTLQELATNLENKEASILASAITTFWRARGAKNIIPDNCSDDESVSSHEELPHKESQREQIIESKGNILTGDKRVASCTAASDKHPSGEELHMQISHELSNDGKLPDEGGSERVEGQHPITSFEDDLRRKNRESVLFAKTMRQKKREEALVGFYVLNSLKSTVASFEEDSLSTLVSATLSNQEKGLDLASVRCREPCHFCHLSDAAICSPLCRVPSDAEWKEMFPHAVHERTSYMIAEMHMHSLGNTNADQVLDNTAIPTASRLCLVRVRVGGELVSSKANTLDYPSKSLDQPMQHFLPRNVEGFQSELKFRIDSNLSVVSGSLTAHEVCAIAAHRMRKEYFLKERREHCKLTLARDAAMSCGKSLPIGQDSWGRTYWVLKAEPKSLFICVQSDSLSQNEKSTAKTWHRFSTPEAIASVIVCLGKDPPAESLKEAYPEAFNMVKDRTWSTLLMQRHLSASSGIRAFQKKSLILPTGEEDHKFGAPFVEDEDVLVESENGRFLWDAVVVDVSRDPQDSQVNGYLVHFKNWSSRFDRWVLPDRVVEPSKNNLLVQTEALEEFDAKRLKAPVELEGMFAMRSFQQKIGKKANQLVAADIYGCTCTRPGASHDERFLAFLKGAILLIEAALPFGAIEYWPTHAALIWRNFVKNAQGPENLLKCMLLLEDAISPDFLRPQSGQLVAALPRQWRAMGEASLAGVALRVAVLDHSLKYSQM